VALGSFCRSEPAAALRVGKGPEFGLAEPFVQLLEVVGAHVHLATHLERLGNVVTTKTQRDRLDRLEVPRDVLAGSSIAAGRSPDEHTVLVDEVDGDAVHLQLGRVCVDAGDEPFGALPPCVQLFEREAVVQAHHRRAMPNGSELIRRRRSHPLRRRVGCHEIGMGLFDGHEIPDEGVVLRVGDLGIVERVITVRVIVDGLAQLVGSLGCLALGAL